MVDIILDTNGNAYLMNTVRSEVDDSGMLLGMIRTDAADCIHRGLEFLSSCQLHRGNFGCFVAKSKGFDNVRMAERVDGIEVEFTRDQQLLFPALIVGHSLLFLRHHFMAARMLDRILSLVQSCRRQGDLWNHSLPGHTFFKMLPDDVDDTSMALAFLRGMGVSVPSLHPVLMANRNEQGLFYTFVTFRCKWNMSPEYWLACIRALRYPAHALAFRRSGMTDPCDLAPALNANVLYYLGDGPRMKPVLQALILMIREGTEVVDNALWYRDKYVIYHFISRNYRQGITELGLISMLIRDRLMADLLSDGSFNGSAQDTAHAICIMLDFGIGHECLKDAVTWLMEHQSADGSWSRQAYYYGCHHDMIAAWGSEEMTTAICLEAIARYHDQLANA